MHRNSAAVDSDQQLRVRAAKWYTGETVPNALAATLALLTLYWFISG